jgi:hypothetical protein
MLFQAEWPKRTLLMTRFGEYAQINKTRLWWRAISIPNPVPNPGFNGDGEKGVIFIITSRDRNAFSIWIA